MAVVHVLFVAALLLRLAVIHLKLADHGKNETCRVGRLKNELKNIFFNSPQTIATNLGCSFYWLKPIT